MMLKCLMKNEAMRAVMDTALFDLMIRKLRAEQCTNTYLGTYIVGARLEGPQGKAGHTY